MSDMITPSLESITVRAKYLIFEKEFNSIQKKLRENNSISTRFHIFAPVGDSIRLVSFKLRNKNGKKKDYNIYVKELEKSRVGDVFLFTLIVLEHLDNGLLVDIECRPRMWYRIAQLHESTFSENQVQEAIIECKSFVRQIMSMFKAKEVEPVSVYPIIQRTEIKGRLTNLGLKVVVGHLDKAEKHITQNNFEDSLKSSRTAFEKTIDWEMKKRGLGNTDNYKNDLERLRSKGFLDKDTT